jgi:NADPH:quinone reductase-like Zn-dependent oxidoreductase
VSLVKSLGANLVIDYTKEDFTAGTTKYDLVFDTVGKSSYTNSKHILTEKGLYLSPVLKLSLLLQMVLTSLFSKKRAKFAATGLRSEAELRNFFAQLTSIFKEGHLKTIIDRQFPLEKVAEAHRYIASGHKRGNVVIVVDPASA